MNIYILNYRDIDYEPPRIFFSMEKAYSVMKSDSDEHYRILKELHGEENVGKTRVRLIYKDFAIANITVMGKLEYHWDIECFKIPSKFLHFIRVPEGYWDKELKFVEVNA